MEALQGRLPLRTTRDQWVDAADEVEAVETRWLRELTIFDSVQILSDLYEGFHSQIEQTEALYRPEKLAYWQEMGRRAGRLAKWQRDHGQSIA